MKKKVVAATLTMSLLISLLALFVCFISLANANFTPLPELPTPIYIRSDGSVEPSTAPLQRNGSIYTLTNDINNTIEVQCSNIVLDGNGYIITKPSVKTEDLMIPAGWLPGVRITGLSNVTVTNIVFEGCVTGVTVDNSSGITVSQNIIREPKNGIVVLSSFNITIVGNNISLTSQSFSAGMIFLPSNPDVKNPYHIMIKGNHIVGNSNQVPASPPQPEQHGIWGGFVDSKMVGNTLNRINGIALYYTGSNNFIMGNNFQENNEGILFSGNSELCVNNTIYFNNFNRNSENVVVPFIRNIPFNFWDNGTVGNFWSDYKGVDADGDGIGDTPYVIETVYPDYEQNKNVTLEEGRDRFPLMNPIDVSSVSVELPNQTPLVTSPSGTTTPEPVEQESFPVMLVAAIVAFATVAVAGLLVYFKKSVRS